MINKPTYQSLYKPTKEDRDWHEVAQVNIGFFQQATMMPILKRPKEDHQQIE